MQDVNSDQTDHWHRWIAIIWLLTAIALVVFRWPAIQWFSLPDTDDNLRMAQVRALLAGQDWYDLRQYKLNPPIGFNVHWSRLVDLPIAALVLAVKPLFGTAVAEKTAVSIAPLLPLFVTMTAMALTVRRLVAPGAFALAAGLLLCCQAMLLMFLPLRIDHHGWQLAFLALTIAGLVDPKPARGGLVMGLSSAASLVVGLELMPFLAIAGAAAVARWIGEPDDAPRLRTYALALSGGCAIGFAGFASYDNRVARCDALSPVWLSTMLAAGALAFALSHLEAGDPKRRLLAAGAGGSLLAVAFALTWPQCLGRPEQVSPELMRLWLSNVREAKPLYTQSWSQVLSIVALPVIGVCGSLWMAWTTRRDARFGQWGPMALVSLVSLLLLLWQSRQGPAAQLLAVPGTTALAWAIIPRLARSPALAVRSIGVIAAFLAVSGLAVQFAIARVPAKPANARAKAIARANFRCPALSALRPVARLPATTIFTFVDLGPRLINVTPHRAVAGPYHRNGDAILDVHRAFGGSPEQARAIMRRHGATHLLTCPNMSESTIYRARSPNGFYSRLAGNERFAWLEPMSLPRGSPLLLWRIR